MLSVTFPETDISVNIHTYIKILTYMRVKLLVSYLLGIIIIVTLVLISMFLNGQIINIPNVTPEGGIITVLGVAIIIITMINVGFFATIILYKIEDKRKLKE